MSLKECIDDFLQAINSPYYNKTKAKSRIVGNVKNNNTMSLKERFEKVANDYIKAFEKKQDMSFEWWFGSMITEWASFGDDLCFLFDDIRLDIDNDVPKGKILEWHRYNLDEYFIKNNNDATLPTTNYRSWLMNEGLLKKEENANDK